MKQRTIETNADLRAEFTRQRVSVKDVAEVMDMTRQALSTVLNSPAPPSRAWIDQILEAIQQVKKGRG